MRPRHAIGLWAVIAVATATSLPAQNDAAQLLDRAIHLYENVEVEDAVTLLRQVIAPSGALEVTAAQRAQAYKYVGAVFALQPGADKRDSAVEYFRAAIALDPSERLDAQAFTPAQVAAFDDARSRTFAIALRPLAPDTLDSAGATVTFTCVTSHAASLRAELRTDTATALVLYEGPADGVHEITWDGTLPGQSPAPTGRYQVQVIGRSNLVAAGDSAWAFFDLLLDHPPLEDTLPELGPQDLLPEVDAERRSIPANELENQRRQEARAANNAAVVARNAEALRRSRLIITPVAVAGQ
ncbi:MAG TPA: hypothetical protein VEH62_00695 [Gemmatimonadales bacterium]|nr:hypothetical protein [Gemmatimonadales bacterium]